jgi:hypothetical protein
MALANFHLGIPLNIQQLGLVGSGKTKSMLELGEQNWFGDVDPNWINKVIDDSAMLESKKAALRAELKQMLALPWRSPEGSHALFAFAKIFYKVVFEHDRYMAVDLHGTPAAYKYDLNEPLPIIDRFDLVTNLGTTEHVFNQFQAFKSIHEMTKPSGIMIHSLPNQGCFDHGFYNYHPTFFYDLCEANKYELPIMLYVDAAATPNRTVQLHSREDYVRLAIAKDLGPYSGLFAVAKKPAFDVPFKVPRQGYYDDRLPAELAEAWRNLPR